MKNKHQNQENRSLINNVDSSIYNEHSHEYNLVRSDLWRVLFVNSAFVIAVLAVYFYDKKTNFLIDLYTKLVK